MSVFCKNCRFENRWNVCGGYQDWYERMKDKAYPGQLFWMGDDTLNPERNCPYYERKRWKFWVKP